VKFNLYTAIYCCLSGVFLTSCGEKSVNDTIGSTISGEFKDYWYAGKAEVGSYNLSQSRYGEDRVGKAMMIFVTEDFSNSKQVKLDNPAETGADKVSVLKLNMTKNFVTGIYPYSMMLSAFTPVERNKNPHTLKLSMSSQEWCGQAYSQLNLRHKNYIISNHSYFENEADEELNLKVSWLEDEVWNRIRLDPKSLPVGEVDIIPGFFFSRLNHIGLDREKARCSVDEEADLITYTISYPSRKRSLAIVFEKVFPHRIREWTEKQEQNGMAQITTATLDKLLIIDYWTKNKNEFLYLRDSLGLSHQNY
jgi:hypothetical protein